MTEKDKELYDKLPEHIKLRLDYKAEEYYSKYEFKDNIVKCKCGGGKTKDRCEFELKGKKIGQKCDKYICKKCMTIIDDKKYCRIHANIINQQKKG